MEWAYADIPNEQLTPIQQSLFKDEWRELGYDIEDNPHVTIVPGYESNEEITKPSVNYPTLLRSGKPSLVEAWSLSVVSSSDPSLLHSKAKHLIGCESVSLSSESLTLTLEHID